MGVVNCHSCNGDVEKVVIDLGQSPFSNSFLQSKSEIETEVKYPLTVMKCSKCHLVQLKPISQGEDHFHDDYVYFSSYSDTWLEHARVFQREITQKLSLDNKSFVMEIASNDGYLLQNFVEADIPCLGIEPSSNTAEAARKKGVPCRETFFNVETAKELSDEGIVADLIVGNNVLAHVPNIAEFVAGLKLVLKPEGVVTLEFPHLLNLIKYTQFDTIYHEHFSYISLISLVPLMERHGLRIFDVEKLQTHGGSLRVYACLEGASHEAQLNVSQGLEEEIDFGLDQDRVYEDFQQRVLKIREDLVNFLTQAEANKRIVVGYGAAAKGNTLLNYCGVTTDLLPSVVDKNPIKQNRLLPGVHIPVLSPDEIMKCKPDYILILPWNIKGEVQSQLSYAREWGAKFVTAVPELEIVS